MVLQEGHAHGQDREHKLALEAGSEGERSKVKRQTEARDDVEMVR